MRVTLGVNITVPDLARTNLVDFISQLENVRVIPDLKQRVVINERTGVIVAGGDAQISKLQFLMATLRSL